MLLFHDAAGEGQPDPPSPGLGRDAWLEQLGPHVRRHARAVVAYGHAGGPCGRLDRDVDPPATPRERVDRVLDHRLERPFDEHGVAQRRGTGPRGRERQGDGARERGQAGPEVAHDPLGHGAEPDRLATRRTPDPLEPLGHPLEPLRVGLKMARDLGGGGIRIIAQVGNPSREAHQRRAELVRRLARHRGPEPIAGRGDLRAVRPHREHDETEEHRALERGEADEPLRHRQGAVVDRADARLHERQVLPVEPGDPRAQPRRIGGDAGGRVVERRDPPRGVGDHDGDAERADLAGQIEQRLRRGVGVRVVEPREDPAEEPARLTRVVAQVPRHHPRVAHRHRAEQQGQPDDGGGRRASQRDVTRHRRRRRGGRSRDTAPAPTGASRSRRAAGASRAVPPGCAAAPRRRR